MKKHKDIYIFIFIMGDLVQKWIDTLNNDNIYEYGYNGLGYNSTRPQNNLIGLTSGSCNMAVGYNALNMVGEREDTGAIGCIGPTGPAGAPRNTQPTGQMGATGPAGAPRNTQPQKPNPTKLKTISPEIIFTPTILLDNLFNSFDNTNPIHMQFKSLCESLSVVNPVNENVKNIVLGYCDMFDVEIVEIFRLVKLDIYNKNLTDFIIEFQDGKCYPCLKAIIKTIPYFDMIFNDIDMNDSLTLSSDFGITSSLLTLVYDQNADELNASNYVEIFEMMDKYLMKEYFYIMLEWAKNNVEIVMRDCVLNNDFDRIKLLYRILKNISDEKFMKDNEFSFNNCENLKKDAKNVINKMFNVTMGIGMILFDDWFVAFTDSQKLKNIYESKRYDLLDIANIKPELVIQFLLKLDPDNDNYDDIFTMINLYNMVVEYGECTNVNGSRFIVESYYPTFKYKKIIRLPANIHMINGNELTMNYFQNSNINIKSGSKLVFGHISKVYNVKQIKRCVKNEVKERVVDNVHYISNKNVIFKLDLDDVYPSDIKLNVYDYEEVEEKIDF
jgi:hypothetical protein